MVLRVPTPAIPGGNQVGNVQVAPSANMPFQSFTVPNLGENFGTFRQDDSDARMWQSGGVGLQQFAIQIDRYKKEQEKLEKEQEKLELITKQNTGDKAARTAVDDAVSQLGANALGGTDRIRVALDAIEKALRVDTGALTRSGKLALEHYLRGLRHRSTAAVMTHERQQRHAHMIEQIDVSIKNSVWGGVTNYLDSNALNAMQVMIAQQSKNRAEMTMTPGSDDAKKLAEQIMRKAVSEMYESSINRALNMEDKLFGVKRAKQLFDEAKGAGLLKNEVLDRIEKDLNTMATDAVARSEGMRLFNRHGQDSDAALAEVAKRKDIDGPTKDAIRKRYEFERAYGEAAKTRAYNDNLRDLLLTARGGDGKVTQMVLDKLDPEDARTVQLEMDYAEGEKSNSNKTNRAVLLEWDAMGVVEKGRLSSDKFLKKYANYMSNVDNRRDEAIEEWKNAVERVRGAQVSAVLLAESHRRTDEKAERVAARRDFTVLVDSRKEMLWPDKKTNMTKRAAFSVAAMREFNQRNEPNILTGGGIRPPLKMVEMDEIIKTTSSRILFAGEDLQVFDVMSDVFDVRGKLVGKRKGEEDWAKKLVSFGRIEERDRFEVIQWYLREKKIGTNVQIDAEKLDQWVWERLFFFILHDAPKQDLIDVNKVLKEQGKEINDTNKEDLYRRWLIHKHGG